MIFGEINIQGTKIWHTLQPEKHTQVVPSNKPRRIQDQVSLNSSSSILKSVTYSPTSAGGDLLASLLTFPKSESVINSSKQIRSYVSPELIDKIKSDPDVLLQAIEDVNSLDEAIEILIYAKVNFKNSPKFIQAAFKEIFNQYGFDETTSDRLSSKGIDITHNLQKKQIIVKLSDKMSVALGCSSNAVQETRTSPPSVIRRFWARSLSMQLAVINKHPAVVENIMRKILCTADFTLTHVSKFNLEHYDETIKNIYDLNIWLKDEVQIQMFQKLKHHWVKCELVTHAMITHPIMTNTMTISNKIVLLEYFNDNLYTSNKELTAELHYRLGVAYLDTDHYDDALKYLQKAYNALPENAYIIRGLISVYNKTDWQQLKTFIDQLSNSDLKKLLQLYHNAKDVTANKVSEIDKGKVPEQFHDYFYTLNFVADVNKAVSCNLPTNTTIFATRIKNLANNRVPIETRVSLAMMCGNVGLAREMVRNSSIRQIALNAELRVLSAILDSTNSNLASSINNYKIKDSEKVALFSKAASSCLSEGNSTEMAVGYVDEGLKLEQNNEELAEIGFAAALVSNNSEKAQEFITMLSPEKKIELAQHYSPDDKESKDIQDLIQEYDPLKIHQYYTIKKQQEIIKLTTSHLLQSSISGWKIDNNLEIAFSDTVSIGKYRGLDCWGYIDPIIRENIKESIGAFDRALENGINPASKNRIKPLGKKAIELKINADIRLYTNIIHVQNGRPLIIFNHIGTHQEVKRFVQKSHITYVQL